MAHLRLTRRSFFCGWSAAGAFLALPLLEACGASAGESSTGSSTARSTAATASASLTASATAAVAASTASAAAAATDTTSATVNPSSATSGPTASASGTVRTAGVVLRLFDYDSPASEAPKQTLLEQFTKQTGFQVQLDPDISGAFEEKLLVESASGSAPDVTKGYGDALFTLIDRDGLVDVTDRVARDLSKAEIDDWLPSQYHMFVVKGHQFALPKYCSGHVYFGNTSLFRQAGLTFPDPKTTWDQLRSTGASLTKKQGAAYTQFALNNGMATLSGFLSQIVWSWGGEVTDPNDNSKCLLDQPAALDALQFIQDLIWKDHIAPQPADVPPLGKDAFGNAKYATEESGSASLRDLHLQHPQLGVDFFPNPLGPTGKSANYHTTDCYALMKGSQSRNTDAGWQLLRFATGPDWGRMLIQAEQMQPARRSLSDEWLTGVRQVAPEWKDAHLEVFIQALDTARPQLRFSNNPKALAILNPVIDAVYNKNSTSARQAFTTAAPRVTAALQATGG